MSAGAADEVVRFWFEELTPKEWYGPPERVDAEIAARFRDTYERLKDGVPPDWLTTPQGFLAAILVLDQFPRNMFRGEPRAFATDKAALALARQAIDEGVDAKLPREHRAFLYMPFQHSENAEDQARSVGLFMKLGNPLNLDYAIRHQEIVARFGRFPHRNAILDRFSTAEEWGFLKTPGSSF
ncbi:MAG: DUF924 family protein [Methyloceanibacter sp.]|uniref:DUF924 family protein n=1 Tax=Methyloceanibacter sp. TaxID=1965321 RepID=UPI003D6CBEC6